jgi:hypothetical protein
MSVQIRSGWLYGTLPDDTGREWPIKRFPQVSARGPLTVEDPNLILHTTETPGYVETLRYPSQWQCGEGIIGQHIKLGYSGDAVNDWDQWAQQIEMVGWSQLGLWLPEESTLGPTVALTAWLHQTGRIKTGLKRPTSAWPTVLDRGPQASESYYRRHANLWPGIAGVYGHVDIPSNKHWDPGSFNYPEFFKRVQAVVEGDDMTEEQKAQLAKALLYAVEAHSALNAVEDFLEGTPPPESAQRIRKRTYRALLEASQRPLPGDHSHRHTHGEDVPA